MSTRFQTKNERPRPTKTCWYTVLAEHLDGMCEQFGPQS